MTGGKVFCLCTRKCCTWRNQYKLDVNVTGRANSYIHIIPFELFIRKLSQMLNMKLAINCLSYLHIGPVFAFGNLYAQRIGPQFGEITDRTRCSWNWASKLFERFITDLVWTNSQAIACRIWRPTAIRLCPISRVINPLSPTVLLVSSPAVCTMLRVQRSGIKLSQILPIEWSFLTLNLSYYMIYHKSIPFHWLLIKFYFNLILKINLW